MDDKTAQQILDQTATVSEGQTISDVIDAALEQFDPATLKQLIDLRQQGKVEAATSSLLSALPVPAPESLSVITTYANDSNATDQWHEFLRAANEALAALPTADWTAYLKSLLDLHKSARLAVPGMEVMK